MELLRQNTILLSPSHFFPVLKCHYGTLMSRRGIGGMFNFVNLFFSGTDSELFSDDLETSVLIYVYVGSIALYTSVIKSITERNIRL